MIVRRVLVPVVVLASVACGPPAISPIELDLSSNCQAVEVVTVVDGVQGSDTPWTAVFAALVDRPGHSSAWLLAAHNGSGMPTIGMFHIDEEGTVDQQWDLGLPVPAAASLELVAGASPGSVYVTERGPRTFYARRFEAIGGTPLAAASSNLAAIPVPCDPDSDGEFDDLCDASEWYQTLVLLGGQPYALTFPPASSDFTVEITPTALDINLEATSGDERTMDFRPQCDPDLPVDDYMVCEALFAERTYPTLNLSGRASSQGGGYLVLAMYREIAQGDDPITTADAPLFLVGISELGGPTGLLRVDPTLPEPRDTSPRNVALDANASYMHYIATDGSPVLVRAGNSALEFERIDEVIEISHDAALIQLDDDIAMHRIVDGDWEVLKIYPDAPEQSQTLLHSASAAIESVEPAGPGSFLLRTSDGEADLVYLQCAILEPDPPS